MARRRMFSLDIIDTDLFIEMPQTSRLLYYELCMRADDDGFVGSPKKIQKMVGCSDDDFKVLITKKFIIPFNTGIVVIRHWKIHNYIQKDRYKETIYLDEKRQLNQEENGMYTECIQDVYNMDTQVRLGKDSIGKDSISCCKEEKEIIKYYEENIGLITPATADLLLDYLKDMDYKLIIEAIKIATLANKRNGRYINGILKDWTKKGYKTLLDLENEKKEKENNQKQETEAEAIARKTRELEEALKNDKW